MHQLIDQVTGFPVGDSYRVKACLRRFFDWNYRTVQDWLDMVESHVVFAPLRVHEWGALDDEGYSHTVDYIKAVEGAEGMPGINGSNEISFSVVENYQEGVAVWSDPAGEPIAWYQREPVGSYYIPPPQQDKAIVAYCLARVVGCSVQLKIAQALHEVYGVAIRKRGRKTSTGVG